MATRLKERIDQSEKLNRLRNGVGVMLTRLQRNPWPCLDEKRLVVGCESSGTTPIGRMLLRDTSRRFLFEGNNTWVWDLYMSVYQGHSRVRDYPALQLFDGIKVPGFAAILEQIVAEFPNTKMLYVVRDPRDILASAYRTHRVQTREELANISWVRETWLGIEDRDPVARLARRWRIYLERSRRVDSVNYIRYEDFCQDKVGCITRLAATMGVDVDCKRLQSQLNRQASDSDARAYQPVGPGSWRQSPNVSDDDVQIVEEVCGDLMREWNYT
jgi:hypothetical protein